MLSLKLILLALVVSLLSIPAVILDAIAEGWRYLRGDDFQ